MCIYSIHTMCCVLSLCLVAQSCLILCYLMYCSHSSDHGDSPGKNNGEGHHALIQVIFPTQELNPGLPSCRQILYHLSHQGSPWILEWMAYPFSRGSSWPRNWTRVSCIAGGFFTIWATREALISKCRYSQNICRNVVSFSLHSQLLWWTL